MSQQDNITAQERFGAAVDSDGLVAAACVDQLGMLSQLGLASP